MTPAISARTGSCHRTKDGLGLAVGVWLGNSDHSYPRSRKPATSLTAAAPLWRAFMRDYTRKWPITAFKRPKDVVRTKIDAWSGGRPGAWTRETTAEWFIRGTQPGSRKAIDKDGLLYRIGCGGWRVDPVQAELGTRRLAGRRGGLAAARAAWARRRGAARFGDGVLLG